MEKQKKRKKHFGLKELRLSIAHMVLWSLLAISFFTYLTIELGKTIERGPFYFIIVLAGYSLIVIALTLVFSHRFIGPFERLKTELRIILSNNGLDRLRIRGKDDIYIRSFILEINKLIDRFEKTQELREKLKKNIDSEFSRMKTLLEKEEMSKDELAKKISALQGKIEDLFREKKKRS